MDLEKIINEMVEEENGRTVLTCTKAHIIAETYGFALPEIGNYCDDKKIKIVKCQLDCFA